MKEPHTVSVSLRIRDTERFLLFLWELRQLVDEMRVMASPHTERLERLIDRFTDGGDDEAESDSGPDAA